MPPERGWAQECRIEAERAVGGRCGRALPGERSSEAHADGDLLRSGEIVRDVVWLYAAALAIWCGVAQELFGCA
jgi:hypothetical protein